MKSSITRYALVVVFSAATACRISKDLPPVTPELPASFAGSPAASTSAADSAGIAAIPWKTFFTAPDLQQLIDTAIVNNYDMQVALQNIAQAQLLLKQTKWNNVPELRFNVTASSSRPSDNSLTGLSLSAFGVGTSHVEDYSANLAISWEADIWGKIRNQSKSALAAYLQTTEAKKTIQTSIIRYVAQGYYNLLMLQTQLAIAQKNVLLNDSTITIIKLQYDAGQVTLLAVEQAKAQQLTAAELVPQFRQDIVLQENALRILAGKLPAAIVSHTLLDDIVIADSLATGIPAALLQQRPDVRSQELALTIANANVGIYKAELYPALRINASGGVNSFRASNWFNIPASLFGIVGGSIFQPLLQHKQLQTQYEVAKIEREKTVVRFRQTVLNAVGEVSDALVKIDQLKTRRGLAATRVQTLVDATANASLLFKNGLANYLEVITAQGNVLQSELNLASIKRSELDAAAELYIALGGGWK